MIFVLKLFCVLFYIFTNKSKLMGIKELKQSFVNVLACCSYTKLQISKTIFSYFSITICDMTPHYICLGKIDLIRGHNICFYGKNKENYPCYSCLSGALALS